MAFGGSVFVWKDQIQFVATYCAATSDAISTDAPGRAEARGCSASKISRGEPSTAVIPIIEVTKLGEGHAVLLVTSFTWTAAKDTANLVGTNEGLLSSVYRNDGRCLAPWISPDGSLSGLLSFVFSVVFFLGRSCSHSHFRRPERFWTLVSDARSGEKTVNHDRSPFADHCRADRYDGPYLMPLPVYRLSTRLSRRAR
jgi:hypothetical protein